MPLTRRTLLSRLAFSTLALGLPTARADGRPIRLAALLELSGPPAGFGASTERGMRLALSEVNAAGGVAGHLVTLDPRDSGSSPETAVLAAKGLLARKAPLAVLGPVGSSRSLAVAALTQAAGVPFVTGSSTNPKITELGDHTFRTCFIDPLQGAAMARWLLSQGTSRVAILHDAANDYSASLVESFRAAFNPGTVVVSQTYTEGDSDFATPLGLALAAGPEALYLPGYYTEVGFLARQARELGFTGQFAGGDGWGGSEVLYMLGRDAIGGGVYTDHFAADDPDSQAFVAAYEARHKMRPDGLAALGYDTIGLVVAALRQVAEQRGAGPLVAASAAGRRALRDAIAATTDYPGTTGSITMGPDRNPKKHVVLCRVTADGPQFVARLPPA